MLKKPPNFFVAVFALFLFATSPVFAADATDAQILHLLNRISFGPVPGDIENVRRIGIDAYIDQQLHPDELTPSSELQSRLKELPTLDASMHQLASQYFIPPEEEKQLSEDARKDYHQRQNVIVKELAEAKILRAVMARAQLQEVMADFWFNHFNVFAEKGADKIFISSYERDAIRLYALGHFRDLLMATARHPAMLFYLDNWLNTNPNSPGARGKKIGINENYAREIMELHTLGVNGGYTQTDVTTLAHILTGWGLGEGKGLENRAEFYFEPRRHDFSDQALLGYHVPGGNQQEIEAVLAMLAKHPATAHHISYELAQYFVADDPPKPLVDKLTSVYKSTDGDIAAMLKTIFRSPEFWDQQYTQNKFKPPFRFVISALRASNVVPPGDTKAIQGAVGQMGEPLYRCPTPNGYSNTNDQWLNSDTLLKRIEFSKKLSNVLAFGGDSKETIESALGGKNWSTNTRQTVDNAEPNLQPAMLLASPEFVYY
jgi:uncharacterized protein (DUF1800 family)